MTKLSKKQILSLSEKERNEYFSAQLAELKEVEKTIKKELARKESAIMAKNRSKINHAKYIVAGEFLASTAAKPFLESLAKSKTFPARTALGLNLLAKDMGLSFEFKTAD